MNNETDKRRYKKQEIIPVYTEEQLLKIGSEEQVLVEQENTTYTYKQNAKYELKNDITVTGNYNDIINKINNKQVEIIVNDKKINHNGIYYTANSKYTIGVNQYGYVANGLQLLYDGIDNAGEGNHSNTTSEWKDLSGNNRDGTLTNMDLSSCWQEDGLKFDGVDDFVLITQMDYDNITLESVNTKASTASTDGKIKQIIANINDGGYNIYQSTIDRFTFGVYIAENAAYTAAPQTSQSSTIDSAKYSISGSYDGNIIKLRTSNGAAGATTYQQSQITGTIGKPTRNTYMVLGANPTGSQIDNQNQEFDGTISSVRIYDRALSDEENAVNFLNDRERYQV